MARDCDKWHLCKAGSFSYGESPWTPPLEGTSLHRWNNSVERPWGILSLFTTCFKCNHPASLWHMWNTPQTAHPKERSPRKHWKDQNHKKSWDLGRRSVWKRPKRRHAEWKEPYEMLNGAKPLSNNNSWAEEGRSKSPKMNQSNQKWALQKPLWKERSPTKG